VFEYLCAICQQFAPSLVRKPELHQKREEAFKMRLSSKWPLTASWLEKAAITPWGTGAEGTDIVLMASLVDPHRRLRCVTAIGTCEARCQLVQHAHNFDSRWQIPE
jgi:hypothetical protein